MSALPELHQKLLRDAQDKGAATGENWCVLFSIPHAQRADVIQSVEEEAPLLDMMDGGRRLFTLGAFTSGLESIYHRIGHRGGPSTPDEDLTCKLVVLWKRWTIDLQERALAAAFMAQDDRLPHSERLQRAIEEALTPPAKELAQ